MSTFGEILILLTINFTKMTFILVISDILNSSTGFSSFSKGLTNLFLKFTY